MRLPERHGDPKTHERIPFPRGRRGTKKCNRSGYPALVLGSSAGTKTLVEIGAREPVAINDLPERHLVTDANLGFTVRRLVALGLVRRYRNPEHLDRYLLALDSRHPLAEPVAALLRVIAARNRLRWTPSPSPSEDFAAVEGPNVTELRPFGHPAGDLLTLLGHPNRTLALFLIAALGQVDPTTIARVVGVPTDGDMLRLMDPLEADGVVQSRMVGSIRLYRLRPARWAGAVKTLVSAVAQHDPSVAQATAVARALMLSGGFSNRMHLRKVLNKSTHQR